MQYINSFESEVRACCRIFPVVFKSALGYEIFDEAGKRYIDFFCAAGSLAYGHNHPQILDLLRHHIDKNGIVNSLDMATLEKEDFIKNFHDKILLPRSYQYKFQFCSPSGANVVEAACKIARKMTGRQPIVSFTNAFHGMSLGALSLSGSRFKRSGAGVGLYNTYFMPYDNYFGSDIDTISLIDKLFSDAGSGYNLPAAFIVETIQGEGGLNKASDEWLLRLQDLAQKYDALLIIDDIQAGCGRTGQFFSFEHLTELNPDIICLSKALSGLGLPMSLLLLKEHLDVWKPGEHNGTFRGNNYAFVTAQGVINLWNNIEFVSETNKISKLFDTLLENLSHSFNEGERPMTKGLGFIRGLEWENPKTAYKVALECFKRGLLVETSGAEKQVLKLLPPLIITELALKEAISILKESIVIVLEKDKDLVCE
ncbi:MAG: diaminobutyrate--2-oxoglutarate transaminase [Proteobacteria bacterium]|nr:diaminobutyrate--2-oxoglutarate transaminase [Pseudomonadota bacterium]